MTVKANTKFVKKKRPISRKFWNILSYLPPFIRKRIIRSKFDLEYSLPDEVTLKQAETESELLQAMRLVHDSYVDLGYMEPNEERMRFSKYMALPTTIILVAKWNEDVIATISLIPDSALGLPTDTTWDLSKVRANGRFIGEVGALVIDSKYKNRRGKLLMAIFKFMTEVAIKVYNLDTFVAATTSEVEPFYTDLLLFKKITVFTGQKHSLVNGNRSACYYLDVRTMPARYKKVYNKQAQHKNLYHYFFEFNLKNILWPKKSRSIHGQLSIKNRALFNIMKTYENLSSSFDERDRLIINNHQTFGEAESENIQGLTRNKKRVLVNEKAWIFINKHEPPISCRIHDVSTLGFQLIIDRAPAGLEVGQQFILLLGIDENAITCRATIRWKKSNSRIGCQIVDEASSEWKNYISLIWREINHISVATDATHGNKKVG